MSEPDEQSATRGLADILREAGISSAGTGGRRRRRDETDSTIEEETATPAPDLPPEKSAGAEPDQPVDWGTRTDVDALRSYLLGDTGTGTAVAGTNRDVRRSETPPPRTDTGPVPTYGWVPRGTGWPQSSAAANPQSSAAATPPAPAAATTPPAPAIPTPATAIPAPATADPANPRTAAAVPSAPAHATRSPSPLATTAPDVPDEIESAAALPSGALSWAILAVELLAALGLGVAAWYAFSALWDLMPYVAAFIGPLVVTGLVAVAGALRARTGRNPLGLPTLCILVFAGTVLVVLPAAALIVP